MIKRFAARQSYANNSGTVGASCKAYSYWYTYINAAQRPWATLNYYLTTVGPKRHQGHRRTCGRIKRDARGTGGREIQETPAGPEGTAGGSGETPRGPEGTKDKGGSEQAVRPGGSNSQQFGVVLSGCSLEAQHRELAQLAHFLTLVLKGGGLLYGTRFLDKTIGNPAP